MQARDIGFPANKMTKPKNQLFCRLDGLTPSARREQRLTAIDKLGLLTGKSVSVLEEATQKAARFTGAPISVLGLVIEEEIWFKSAVGLSTTSLTDRLATERRIPLAESFSTYVIDSQQSLTIDNTLSSAIFADSILAQHYGIKTYLGVPLVTASGICLGTLEVMDWTARKFDDRDIDYLMLLARWCLGEFERTQSYTELTGFEASQWQKSVSSLKTGIDSASIHLASNRQLSTIASTEKNACSNTNPIKIRLLSQLTQELKTPLTSVIGMASVLYREVYGPLTVKQKEYLEIIHNSGQNLITLVDEIVSLGVLSDRASEIELAAVDIEMLCQQVINSLTDIAKQHQQKLNLSIEPGNRVWFLDKEKVRQALYYLIVSVLEMSEPGGEIRVHVSKRDRALNIAVGIIHPWLGEDFGTTKLHSQTITEALRWHQNYPSDRIDLDLGNVAVSENQVLTASALMMAIDGDSTVDRNTNKIPRDILGLLFCCHLTELHQGQVVVRGSGSSYRYLLQFPHAKSEEA